MREMNMTIDTILSLLKEPVRIAVIAHILPDGDTIGSCLALADMLRAEGKSVSLFCQDTPSATLGFLYGLTDFKGEERIGQPYDLAIAVDCSDMERMGICSAAFRNSRHTMNLDHHPGNTYFAQANYVDPKASATGEIVYRIAVRMPGTIGRYTAEALYTAISTDSGRFSFSNTTSDTYRIVAELVDCGINVEEINDFLYQSYRVERIRLLSKALNSLTLYENGKVALMTISREDLHEAGAKDSDTENIVNYAKNIVGVQLGIFLREMPDGTTKASFRSKGDMDVNKLAGLFGGGGHNKASGANIATSLTEARNEILAAFHSRYKEWV